MSIKFDALPRAEKKYLIESMGLPLIEENVLLLKYVKNMNYSRIAYELHISEKSVGSTLTKARKHVVCVSKTIYPLADERLKAIIDAVGWLDLEWPTMWYRNRQ